MTSATKRNMAESKKGFPMSKGIAIGTILGIAAGLFLQTKKGKQFTSDAAKKAQQLQKQVMKKLDQVQDMTKERYEEVVDDMLGYYVKAKDVAKTEVPEVRKYLLSRWRTIEDRLKKED